VLFNEIIKYSDTLYFYNKYFKKIPLKLFIMYFFTVKKHTFYKKKKEICKKYRGMRIFLGVSLTFSCEVQLLTGIDSDKNSYIS